MAAGTINVTPTQILQQKTSLSLPLILNNMTEHNKTLKSSFGVPYCNCVGIGIGVLYCVGIGIWYCVGIVANYWQAN